MGLGTRGHSKRKTGVMVIGADVISGTPTSVLYIDASGNFAQDPTNFNYTPTSRLLTLGNSASGLAQLNILSGANGDYINLENDNVATVGNYIGINFNLSDDLSFPSPYGQMVISSTNVSLAQCNAKFALNLFKNSSPSEVFSIDSNTDYADLRQVGLRITNTGPVGVPQYLLSVVQSDSSQLQTASFQGYSDGGFATKGVLEIKNELGQRMCLLAGSNLAGAGDYGEMMFYGTATAAQNLYSFGDFNWINNSGEASGDLRVGTFRVYRDGSAYQGTFSLVLRNGSGSFITSITAKYSGQVGLKDITNPTAWLNIPAGTTSASTSPIKFTTGSLLSTPEVGALEYTTDELYFTQSTNTARHNFAWQDNPIAQQVFS